jgi:hypothetical protein
MNFEQVEKNARDLVSKNKLQDAIALLSDFFADDEDLDNLLIQLANYNALLDNQVKGIVDYKEVELTLNKLRAQLLQFLRAKKDYLKYRSLTFGANSEEKPASTDKIKVFFSVASPHNDEQHAYINRIIEIFDRNGIALETLKSWNDNDPLVPIMNEMKASHGCLVLALERMMVLDGIEKPRSEQETKVQNVSLTSTWLQIESALARSYELPLIILKDVSLKNDGLIHNDKQEWGIVIVDQTAPEQVEQYPVKNFLLNWINQVKKHAKGG